LRKDQISRQSCVTSYLAANQAVNLANRVKFYRLDTGFANRVLSAARVVHSHGIPQTK